MSDAEMTDNEYELDDEDFEEVEVEVLEPRTARFRPGKAAWIVYVGGGYDHAVKPQILKKDPHTHKPIKRKVAKPAQLMHIHQESITVAGMQQPDGIEFPLGQVVKLHRLKPNRKGKMPGRCIVDKCDALSAFDVWDECPVQVTIEEEDEQTKVQEMEPMHDELAFPGQYDPDEMDMQKGRAGDVQLRQFDKEDEGKSGIQTTEKPPARIVKTRLRNTSKKKVTKKKAARKKAAPKKKS